MTENKNVNAQLPVAEENMTLVPSQIVRENDDHVVKIIDGKYVRKAKYKEYSSFSAETKEEKIWLLNLFDGDEESGNGLKDHCGKHIKVDHVIFRQYDKINEETGDLEYGVLTYLITPEKVAYVTSSKNVYFSMTHIMEVFGNPTEEEWDVTVQAYKKKEKNGDSIKIKLV